jgi:outer membrane receptor protein involved in Fe transport
MSRWSRGRAHALAIVIILAAPPAAGLRAAPGSGPGQPGSDPAGGPAVSPEDAVFLDPAITGEAIVVWGERPDKPFDRDTLLRLTGEELARRGASNLADALDLLPDLVVREQGRGGRQVEIRGARKGSVKVVVDGASISDPYYGNLDLSSIPVTDIVQIRVSSSPASPIDGVGGPGGVIEVHTRDAIGPRLALVRVLGSSLPSAEASATGRAAIAPHLALRASASGTLGLREFAVMPDGAGETVIGEDRRQAASGLRLEYRRGPRRAVADLWAQTGGYVVPPGEDGVQDILVIDRETQARAGLSVDGELRGWRVQARGYGHLLRRDSRTYADLALEELSSREELEASRAGGALLASRALGPRVHLIGSAALDSEVAHVAGFDEVETGGRATLGEMAGGMQFADGPWRLDGAAGLAAPLGIDAAVWPEAKLIARFSPVAPVELRLIGGRKGRLPTLRERFRPDIGSESLGPEQVWFGETELALRPGWLEIRLAGYVRRSNGLIRLGTETRELVNLGALDTRGLDASLAIAPGPGRAIGGGASYSFTDAVSEESGTDALDFLPRHRATAWIEGRLGRAGWFARVRSQSEQIDRQAALPSRTLVDVSAWAALPADLAASVRLENAAGAAHHERLDVPAPGRVLVLAVQGEWR